MKTTQDNNVINHLGAFYIENNIELSWLIGFGAIYDENQIRQWCDRLYRCDLHQKNIELSWMIE